MPAPKNPFKQALAEKRPQLGLWMALANNFTAELCARAGFDWLVIDGEHAPNDLRSTLAQLQAMEAYDCHGVVRIPIGDTVLVKQVLDLGAQTILVPMVETVEQAEEMAHAMRYPPHGVRGIGAALARASGYGTIKDYLATANDEVCLLLQLESKRAMENIEAIAAVEGVDGLFIGPADLAADMGYTGQPGAPEALAAVEKGLKRIMAAGKPAGILTADQALAHSYLAMGATFVAVGTDVGVLSGGLAALRSAFPRG